MFKIILYWRIGRRKKGETSRRLDYLYVRDLDAQDILDRWNRIGRIPSKHNPDVDWEYRLEAEHSISPTNEVLDRVKWRLEDC